jgi:hypothetical protein
MNIRIGNLHRPQTGLSPIGDSARRSGSKVPPKALRNLSDGSGWGAMGFRSVIADRAADRICACTILVGGDRDAGAPPARLPDICARQPELGLPTPVRPVPIEDEDMQIIASAMRATLTIIQMAEATG